MTPQDLFDAKNTALSNSKSLHNGLGLKKTDRFNCHPIFIRQPKAGPPVVRELANIALRRKNRTAVVKRAVVGFNCCIDHRLLIVLIESDRFDSLMAVFHINDLLHFQKSCRKLELGRLSPNLLFYQSWNRFLTINDEAIDRFCHWNVTSLF